MKAELRRKEIVNHLLSQGTAVSGGKLSDMFGVSRQIIVADISRLKSEGYEILSTHRGYVITYTPTFEKSFKVHHTTERTEEELMLIVKNGGTVVDVYVWHKVYGKVSATLNICTEAQVKQFIDGVRSGKSTELMHITGGYHYHTVRTDSEAELNRISELLSQKGFIAPEIE